MIHCRAYALSVASVITSVAFAADWPAATPTFLRTDFMMPVEWTRLYFGVNPGYGWALGSTNAFLEGDFAGDTTTPFGLGRTELSGTRLSRSGNPSGAIAGGQIGSNWQAGTFVFGAELDGQWLGRQSGFTVTCTTDCTAIENVKIRSLATGSAG
jgi:outer membrane immunogenic protein